MRFLKSVHSWLGVFVLPWVLTIGLTGIYLNHERALFDLLPGATYDEARFDDPERTRPIDPDNTLPMAERIWPGQNFQRNTGTRYHGRAAIILDGDDGQIIFDLATGHYWIKTSFRRRTFTPDGQLLDTQIYWGSIFKRLHTRGWIDGRFGTWAADITGGAMAIFALSGIVLFLIPRIRRRRNRRQRNT
ncbi:MAG: PepSY domain-containing protein [Albidovulum sp.]|uniref:PepSY domain-containing protein n=1 Tax=Albidovulum sp. TaxID=1872424 RepID=UPI003C963467